MSSTKLGVHGLLKVAPLTLVVTLGATGCAHETLTSMSTGSEIQDFPLRPEQREQVFRILDEVSSYRPLSDYKPQTVIRAVNALQPLGKEQALDTIDEYLKANYGEGVFLVLRVLFDVPRPPGHMPKMRVGDMGAPTPQDHHLLARSPIVLHDDIPFLLGSGFFLLSGVAEAPERHVRYFRRHGKLRAKPLSPGMRPVESLAHVIRVLEKEKIFYNKEAMTKQARSLVDAVPIRQTQLESAAQLEHGRNAGHLRCFGTLATVGRINRH